ncbi:GntR family transcriptional regulator [Pandoraea eparura]|jgi:GntR family transcriptional regulator/MocR family aminotransferase|uniref:GntR family transcriptional regulator n=1 Tax=Pandoraea eparura TaxID=2508291 RepID=A0A5E4RNM2_9BURK|nr:PLP-dependent aminotransferase family protein [Pandoraea eparura]VVD63669.1 GntR family transcriptional regulator [Pandoraea eparura]
MTDKPSPPALAALHLAAAAQTVGVPTYRALYERIRDGILSGKLAPSTRLPSTRSLASELGVARGTVEAAYERLVAEGFVIGRGAAGSRVNPQLDTARLGAAANAIPAGAGPRTVGPGTLRPACVVDERAEAPGGLGGDLADNPDTIPLNPVGMPFPLQNGLPALDEFPRKLWARLAARRARHLSHEDLHYQNATGWAPLREAIAGYLAIARGIHCDPGQIVVTAGYQGALALVAGVILRPGDAVWCEDPGYFRAQDALKLARATLVPIPVDQDGLDVAAGERTAPNARLAIVTPSHQSPLSVALPLARRLALLAWAQANEAWIVEDDYDSEFRYTGAPLPALKSLDGGERVVYAGSFSKVLFPGLRLGYLVVPPSLADAFTAHASLACPAQGLIEQATVTDFITQGHFSRHIKRMRQLYAQRRAALADALRQHLAGRIELAHQAGGMHLLGWLETQLDDRTVCRIALRHGLAPGALTRFCLARALPPALVMSFTNVPETLAGDVAQRLARTLDAAAGIPPVS